MTGTKVAKININICIYSLKITADVRNWHWHLDDRFVYFCEVLCLVPKTVRVRLIQHCSVY